MIKQPIETAPKDGSYILGWEPSTFDVNGFYGVVYWKDGEWRNGYGSECDGEPLYNNPTHWYELPDYLGK